MTDFGRLGPASEEGPSVAQLRKVYIMAGNVEELARLERRIDDVRHAIEQARHRSSWFGGIHEQEKVIALLAATLNALEARKAALLSTNH